MKKILIIEDNIDTVKVLAKRLSVHGFKVISAVDAYQGTETTHKEKPDLIILDLMLPAGGGAAVLENIKLSVRTFDIPIVVLTAMKNEEYKEKILAEGVDAYFEKPYDFEELITTIHNLLKKR